MRKSFPEEGKVEVSFVVKEAKEEQKRCDLCIFNRSKRNLLYEDKERKNSFLGYICSDFFCTDLEKDNPQKQKSYELRKNEYFDVEYSSVKAKAKIKNKKLQFAIVVVEKPEHQYKGMRDQFLLKDKRFDYIRFEKEKYDHVIEGGYKDTVLLFDSFISAFNYCLDSRFFDEKKELSKSGYSIVSIENIDNENDFSIQYFNKEINLLLQMKSDLNTVKTMMDFFYDYLKFSKNCEADLELPPDGTHGEFVIYNEDERESSCNNLNKVYKYLYFHVAVMEHKGYRVDYCHVDDKDGKIVKSIPLNFFPTDRTLLLG